MEYKRRTDKRAMTAAEVEEIYSVNQGTLANKRCMKTGPKYFRVGRKVYYKPEDVERWLFNHPVMTVDSIDG